MKKSKVIYILEISQKKKKGGPNKGKRFKVFLNFCYSSASSCYEVKVSWHVLFFSVGAIWSINQRFVQKVNKEKETKKGKNAIVQISSAVLRNCKLYLRVRETGPTIVSLTSVG